MTFGIPNFHRLKTEAEAAKLFTKRNGSRATSMSKAFQLS
jgi:hypothetical protein